MTTWHYSTSAATLLAGLVTNPSAIAAGNNTFVVPCQSSGTSGGIGVAVSTDNGATWAFHLQPNGGQIAFGAGVFAMPNQANAGSANIDMYTSADGVTWTDHALDLSTIYGSAINTVHGLSLTKFVNGLFYLIVDTDVSGRSALIFSSADGATWDYVTQVLIGAKQGACDLDFGAGVFVFKVSLTATGPSYAYHGAALNALTQVQLSTSVNSYDGVAFGNGLFVTTNYQDQTLFHSSDGATWTSSEAPEAPTGIVFLDDKFYLSGFDTTPDDNLYSSSDGITWTKETMPSPPGPGFAASNLAALGGNLVGVDNFATNLSVIYGSATVAVLPNGKGDITNPNAWMDLAAPNALPPTEYNNLNVQGGVGFPNNGDGRYWWTGNASSVTGGAIVFVGDPAYLIDTGVLIWQIEQAANDGSQPVLEYSRDGGATWTSVDIGFAPDAPQASINQSGSQDVTLTGATGFAVQLTSTGGTPTEGAAAWKVAIAIVRNVYAVVPWDLPRTHDPISYNAEIGDLPNTETLGTLLSSLMYRLGFAAQAANPPPGMVLLLTQFLQDSQKVLYRKYSSLHMRRFFRWKIVPGIRFYSLKDNDENVLGNFTLDPLKTIEWAGIQDNRDVWYPLIQGIPPQLYTMISKPWRPARYEIRQAIEVYPAPDQTYWLWLKGHFGLLPFASNDDVTTIDSELVYLHALANAKAHYGQPDANNVMGQATDYLGQLVAGTHGTRTYVPGTLAVPPAVRPTLIQYEDHQSA